MKVHLGVDVGSVTTKFAVLDQDDDLLTDLYLGTLGPPVQIVQEGLRQLARQLPAEVEVASVGVTGSARRLTGIVVGADVVKNEITAHAVAAASARAPPSRGDGSHRRRHARPQANVPLRGRYVLQGLFR